MPYEVLEQKFHSLPIQSFDEVSDFFDYILYKFRNTQSKSTQDDIYEKMNTEAEKIKGASLECMREALKDDTW